MAKVTYEVITATSVLNNVGDPIKKLPVGEEITGEMVNVDGEPHVEINSTKDHEEYVVAKAVAQKLSKDSPSGPAAAANKIKASNKKIIFAIGGAVIGYGIGHLMKMDVKKKVLLTIGGMGAALLAEYVNNRKK